MEFKTESKRVKVRGWVITSFRWGTRRHQTWSQEEQANCRSTAGMRSSWARWNMRRLASVSGRREVATACEMGRVWALEDGHSSSTNINISPLVSTDAISLLPQDIPHSPEHGCSPCSTAPIPTPWTHLDVPVLLHVLWWVLHGDTRGKGWRFSLGLLLSYLLGVGLLDGILSSSI